MPFATPTVLLGFLLPWMWGILHVCSSKAQLLLLTLDKVAPPDLECGVAPLGPPVPMQPLLLELTHIHLHILEKMQLLLKYP